MFKSIIGTVLAAALFATASISFAGRYGDDEVRHWQQIKKLQEMKQDQAGAAGRKGDGNKADAGTEPAKRFPFRAGPRSL